MPFAKLVSGFMREIKLITVMGDIQNGETQDWTETWTTLAASAQTSGGNSLKAFH
jgi:hypothetical protein